jgi:hypothetical protein
MGAYDTIDKAIKGLKYGDSLSTRIEGGWACAESDGILFGEPVFGYIDDDIHAYNFHNDVGKIVFDGDFVASNVITITVNGVDAADVTFATDHDTTAALVVAAVNALSGAKCLLDPADTDNRTFLIQTKGFDAVVAEAITGGGELWVTPAAAVEANNEAYVDNSGADIGEFSNAGVAINARYRSSGAADALVRLRVHGQTEMTYAGSFSGI